MAKFCRYCGSPVREGAKFCRNCGKALVPVRPEPETASVQKKETARVRKPAEKVRPRTTSKGTAAAGRTVSVPEIQTLTASAAAGEMDLDMMDLSGLNSITEQVTVVLSPISGILHTIGSFAGGILKIFISPGAFIGTVLLAFLWYFLSLFKGSADPTLQTISRFFYAEGGFESNALGIAGGILGKGTVAAALASLFAGGIPSAVKGIGSLFRTKGDKRSLLFTLFGLICGAGSFYFLNGTNYPSSETAAVGIAGILLSLEILGSKNNVFYTLIQSLTSKKVNGVRSAMNGRCESMLTGITLGFSLMTVLSIVL